jgi:DNA gyrase subunit A
MGTRASRTPTAPAVARSSCARSSGRGDPGPAVPGRHRAALPGQPRPPRAEDRRARQGRPPVQGIADIRDETSGRTGQRLVIVLKRDAVAKVVLNNLYKHTQLQTTSARTCWRSSTACRARCRSTRSSALGRAPDRRHPAPHGLPPAQGRGAHPHPARLLKALDMLDEVIALIRRSPTVDAARTGSWSCWTSTRSRPRRSSTCSCAASPPWSARRSSTSTTSSRRRSLDYTDILAKPVASATIISDELAEIVAKFGDDRRTQILPFDGDMSMEDLIPEEDVVVTITRGGYAKRTKVDAYRSSTAAARVCKGAKLRGEDMVDHFFTTTSHHWLLFFTNKGRVYRAKAYELPDAGRDSQGPARRQRHGLPARGEDRPGAGGRDYSSGAYLVLATKSGLVKKTRLDRVRQPAQRWPHRGQPARRRRARRGRPGRGRPTTCCSSPARASRCASTPTTPRCARWAAPPRASPA